MIKMCWSFGFKFRLNYIIPFKLELKLLKHKHFTCILRNTPESILKNTFLFALSTSGYNMQKSSKNNGNSALSMFLK